MFSREWEETGPWAFSLVTGLLNEVTGSWVTLLRPQSPHGQADDVMILLCVVVMLIQREGRAVQSDKLDGVCDVANRASRGVCQPLTLLPSSFPIPFFLPWLFSGGLKS